MIVIVGFVERALLGEVGSGFYSCGNLDLLRSSVMIFNISGHAF